MGGEYDRRWLRASAKEPWTVHVRARSPLLGLSLSASASASSGHGMSWGRFRVDRVDPQLGQPPFGSVTVHVGRGTSIRFRGALLSTGRPGKERADQCSGAAISLDLLLCDPVSVGWLLGVPRLTPSSSGAEFGGTHTMADSDCSRTNLLDSLFTGD